MSAVLEAVNDPVIPQTLSVSVPVTNEAAQAMRANGALALAHEFDIDSPEMAQCAADQRRDWAQNIDKIKAVRDAILAPFKKAIETSGALFNPAIGELEAARNLVGQKLLTWDTQEKARIAAENAKREAEARRIRQEAEARAAQERAKAEEAARAEREKAAAAEAERSKQAAEAERLRREGNAKAAAEAERKAHAASADAAKANEKAASVVENAEARAAEVQTQAAAAASAAPMAEQVKVAGAQFRDNWVAELARGQTEDDAKKSIALAVATDPQLLAYLKIDWPALNKSAKALKKQMRVPGIEAVNNPVVAGSRK